MTHRRIALATAGALALCAAPVDAKTKSPTITLKARSQLERVQLVDAAPTGASAGDMLVFTEKLFDPRGRRIGSDAASCVRLFDESWLCTGTYRLPGGRIMVQLHQPGLTGERTYDQAITGGTGRFAAARGTVRVAQSPSGDRFTFKIRLDR
jgi:hypothetical protein